MSDAVTYGIGVVGCGRAATELHLPALQSLPEARIVAVADAEPAARESTARRFGVTERCPDVTGLLQLPEVDVVAVCVPVTAHVAAAIPVIESGRHVLVEKPLATVPEDCERLISAATGKPVRTAVGFNLRFHRLVQDARAAVESGRLGRIEGIQSTWSSAIRRRRDLPAWRNDRATGGGALFEIAIHHFDLWRFLAGSEITEIHAVSHSGDTPDETVGVTARHANGAISSGMFSECSADQNTLELLGREGRMKLDLFRYDGLNLTLADELPGLGTRMRKSLAAAAGIPKGIALMRKGGDFLLSYQHQWRQFLHSIGSGAFEGATLEDGYAAVRAVLAAVESADTRRPVML
ncbi:MAG: Gfo/Idh/MocA family oxidoreductase [Lysobacterales bacterium]|jgi:predicted dehydrogenase